MNFIYLERPLRTRARANLPLCAWVRLSTLAHSQIADRGIQYTRIPRVYALFCTHDRQYHAASLLFALFGSRFTIRFPCTMNVRARCPALLQRGSGREKLDNRRLNLHFFLSRLFHNGEMQYPLSRLQYWHTSYANSASLSGQEKSSCGTFQILLCFQLHILNYILIIQRYDRF